MTIFAYLLYIYIREGCQNTFACTPTCSPGFHTLKIHMKHSFSIPDKPCKFPEGDLYGTLNVISRLATNERASDRGVLHHIFPLNHIFNFELKKEVINKPNETATFFHFLPFSALPAD